MSKVFAHVIVVPRWFALPGAMASIVLGGVLGHASIWHIALACLVGCFLMAACHSWNSFHDYSLTGFDKGRETERSKRKLYTGAQNVIAEGILSPGSVLFNSLCWLLLATAIAIPLSLMTSMWLWLPFGLVVLCAPWYRWAKLRWHPEIPLGLGFGSFAVMLGCSVGSNPTLLYAFLAGLPYAILFGVACETVDQEIDAEINYPKGLRNIGVLAWQWQALRPILAMEIFFAYLVLALIVTAGILSEWAFRLSLLAVPLLILCLMWIIEERKRAIIIGLLGTFAFAWGITLGQSL